MVLDSTVSVVGWPGEKEALRGCFTISGDASTRTVAMPSAVPLQWASETLVIQYCVEAEGVTVREVEVVGMPFCVKPSDQTRLKGGVPSSVTGMLTASPAQMPSCTPACAVGPLTCTVALPVNGQPSFVIVTLSVTSGPVGTNWMMRVP